jgi:hypothetical protein
MDQASSDKSASDFSGKLREHWDRINDEDVSRIERDDNALSGVLQKRYGLSREAAEHQAKVFISANRVGSSGQPSPWENAQSVPSGQLVAGGAPGDPQRGKQSPGGGSAQSSGSSPRGGSTPSGNPQAGNARQDGGGSPSGNAGRGTERSGTSGNSSQGSGQAQPMQRREGSQGQDAQGQQKKKATRPGSDADEDVSEERRTGETRATPAGGEVDHGGDKDDQEAESGGRSADADE